TLLFVLVSAGLSAQLEAAEPPRLVVQVPDDSPLFVIRDNGRPTMAWGEVSFRRIWTREGVLILHSPSVTAKSRLVPTPPEVEPEETPGGLLELEFGAPRTNLTLERLQSSILAELDVR